MTIGIDASRANEQARTGTEWYAWHVIRELLRQHPAQQFILYTRAPLVPDLRDAVTPNTRVRVLRWPPQILWTQIRLSWELLWHKPDVLFVPAHTIPLVHPKATVTTIHDIGFETHPELYGQGSVARTHGVFGKLLNVCIRLVTGGRFGNSELDYHRWSLRLALAHAAQILTVSEFTKQELQRVLQVPASKVTVAYPGFEPSEHSAQVDTVSLPSDYILYVGRLERKKNIARLLQAYELLQKRMTPCPALVLVGRWGEGAEEIKEQLQWLSNPDDVHILPWLPPATLTRVRAQARAFVFASSYEGFGLPVIEAFDAGIPVVCSTAGSLPEVAGDAAELVSPSDPASIADGLYRVLTDDHRRRELIARGRTQAKQFQWSKTATLTFEVLNEAAVAQSV